MLEQIERVFLHTLNSHPTTGNLVYAKRCLIQASHKFESGNIFLFFYSLDKQFTAINHLTALKMKASEHNEQLEELKAVEKD